MIKKIPNILTILRIILSICILFVKPLSALFFIIYVICGVSDMLDGYIARKSNSVTNFGAALDSTADLLFLTTVFISLFPVLVLPWWIYLWVILIILIRFSSYILAFIKYKAFSSIHTYLNKATGLLLFISPVLYILMGIEITGLITGICATISATEELIIIIKSKELDIDIKTILK